YRRASSRLKTPTDWKRGFAGLVKGPSILKNVFTPSARRIGATVFIAGRKRGACKKQMLAVSNCLFSVLMSLVKRYPKASITFEEPQPEETPMLPCLAT